ncbi:hypothetical protein C5E10_11640 [Pseudoclavibacter sp. RFBG4]|uniref:hypothetical protein n=1 Tax=Pseudoclavibacter sp. RFBG4 TaxID=2080575 RepID=UPI000CE8F016|nr:hypothetical protein [Pseudoclavibacter sp. RFBG4]PPG30782.1 hypothetical protein C5E10_11640 [Pseudoclavibacter sp. RFBG4]
MGISTLTLAISGVAGLLLIGLPALPAVAAPEEDSKTSYDAVEPMDSTNLKLVEGLDAQGECLFRSAVYPAGGIGYEDSSLPYDEYSEVDAAFLTVRAQALRAHPNEFMDLYADPSDPTQRTGVLVATQDWKIAPESTLEALSRNDSKLREALDILDKEGIEIRVENKTALSVNQVCQTQDSFFKLTNSAGKPLNLALLPDPPTGQLQVLVGKSDVEIVTRHAEQFGKLVRVETEGEGVEAAGRYNDSAPWNGGNRTEACSNAFRVNTTGTVTAAHCSQGVIDHADGAGGYMGTTTSSLKSAKVDAMVIKGSSYSRNVWMGGVLTSSALPAYGLYPANSIQLGNQVLVSGSKSGQATLSYVGMAGGCLTYDGTQYCQIQRFWAQPGKFIKGDSGGPVAAYDPANGRIIPLGIVAAIPLGVDVMTTAHSAYVTRLEAAAYLWGGSTFG